MAFASTGGPRVSLVPSSDLLVASGFDAVSSDTDDDEIVDLRGQATQERKAEIEQQISDNRKGAWLWMGVGVAMLAGGGAMLAASSQQGACVEHYEYIDSCAEYEEPYDSLFWPGYGLVMAGIWPISHGFMKLVSSSVATQAVEAVTEDDSSAFIAPDVSLTPTDGGLFGSLGWSF